jgi:hypothetical protein
MEWHFVCILATFTLIIPLAEWTIMMRFDLNFMGIDCAKQQYLQTQIQTVDRAFRHVTQNNGLAVSHSYNQKNDRRVGIHRFLFEINPSRRGCNKP